MTLNDLNVEEALTAIHCVQKKTPTYVFDYNSGISWSIFILFIPMESGMNTLQHTYLTARWRHNCVTFNVTEVYFVELKINIGRFHCVQEKTPTFVLIVTLTFLCRFLCFLYYWKQHWIFCREANKIYDISLNVSSHYLT